MDTVVIYVVMFLTTVLPSALMLAVLIGVPVYAVRRFRRESVLRRRVVIVLGSASAIPILLVVAEGISIGMLFALRALFGGD